MQAEYESTAEGVCRMHFDAMEKFGQLEKGRIIGGGLESWLVQHGAIAFDHTPRPDWLERMTPNECFKNAYVLTTDWNAEGERAGLRYFEGNVMGDALPLLIHHAWCVTEDGTVVDPTLPEDHPDEQITYFGVEVPLKDLLKTSIETEHYGVLHTRIGRELIERNHADRER